MTNREQKLIEIAQEKIKEIICLWNNPSIPISHLQEAIHKLEEFKKDNLNEICRKS